MKTATSTAPEMKDGMVMTTTFEFSLWQRALLALKVLLGANLKVWASTPCENEIGATGETETTLDYDPPRWWPSWWRPRLVTYEAGETPHEEVR